MTPQEKQRGEFERKVRNCLRRILRAVNDNHPDLIVAGEIHILYKMCWGYIGEGMAEYVGKEMIREGRIFVGCCTTCGVGLTDNERVSKMECCFTCDEDTDEMVRKMEEDPS